MHITEQLLYGAIRIEATDGTNTSTGTGFFFNFYLDDNKHTPIPVIITNKHVVKGFSTIKLFFKKGKDDQPDNSPALIVEVPNNDSTILQHPNPNVDLVAIPTAPISQQLSQIGIGVFYIATDESRIADDLTLRQELKSIEDVLMIGYPSGLWDTQNNLPIVRKGITATTPYIDYNGKREFLIDIAAFGGSSGSPIYYYRDIYTDKNYVAKINPKLYLLGVLYAGPLYSVEGKVIKVISNESFTNSGVKTNIPMNLGYVIKASELLEFKKLLLKMISK